MNQFLLLNTAVDFLVISLPLYESNNACYQTYSLHLSVIDFVLLLLQYTSQKTYFLHWVLLVELDKCLLCFLFLKESKLVLERIPIF